MNPDKSLEVYVPITQRDPKTLTREELMTQNEMLKGDVRAAEKAYERVLDMRESESRSYERDLDLYRRRIHELSEKVYFLTQTALREMGNASIRLLALQAEVRPSLDPTLE